MRKSNKESVSQEDAFEKRSQIIQERNSEETVVVGGKEINKISHYRYKIYITDKPPLEGTLSREEVEKLFRLYSFEGSSLSQKTVAREFPGFTFSEFKKIQRAFRLTKASSPMAPHLLEERDYEDLIILNQEHKEADFQKKIEQDKLKNTEIRLRDLQKEHFNLKQSVTDFSAFLKNIKVKPIERIPDIRSVVSNKTIVVYLSDMHVGADVSKYSIYTNKYDKEEVENRLSAIFHKLQQMIKEHLCSKVVICNLGDALDGYNNQTTRGGHLLPQNMDNKEQVRTYIETMTDFFVKLNALGLSSVEYYSVGEDNHSGDFGYTANTALVNILKLSKLVDNAVVFDKYIDYFTVGKQNFILCHGKDQKDVYKNMPLTLNDKTENQINAYLDHIGIIENAHFIKGDLHQSATTYGRRFRYKSVGSFFGSSEWIHKNYGDTKAVCDIDVVSESDILETRVVLN